MSDNERGLPYLISLMVKSIAYTQHRMVFEAVDPNVLHLTQPIIRAVEVPNHTAHEKD